MKNIVFVLLILPSFLIGQVISGGYAPRSDVQASHSSKIVPIVGSQYVQNLYKMGETVINGKSSSKTLMRYDALNEAIEVLDENRQARKLLRRKSIIAKFDGKTYAIIDFKEGNRIKSGYLNPLNQGETVLYFRPKKKFVQAAKPDNGYDTFHPPVYQDISEYYIKKGDEPAVLVKLNKGRILRLLDENHELLKNYIITENLNLRKEEDVIRLLDHYNDLPSEVKPKKELRS